MKQTGRQNTNCWEKGSVSGAPWFRLALQFLIRFQLQCTCVPAANLLQLQGPRVCIAQLPILCLFTLWHPVLMGPGHPWMLHSWTSKYLLLKDFSFKYSYEYQREEEKGQLSGRADVKLEGIKSAILPLKESSRGDIYYVSGFFRVRSYLQWEPQERVEGREKLHSTEGKHNIKR